MLHREGFRAGGEYFHGKENVLGGSLIMAPAGFGIGQYKFSAKETVKETDKQLRLTRLMAFGRSLTSQGWS